MSPHSSRTTRSLYGGWGEFINSQQSDWWVKDGVIAPPIFAWFPLRVHHIVVALNMMEDHIAMQFYFNFLPTIAPPRSNLCAWLNELFSFDVCNLDSPDDRGTLNWGVHFSVLLRSSMVLTGKASLPWEPSTTSPLKKKVEEPWRRKRKSFPILCSFKLTESRQTT